MLRTRLRAVAAASALALALATGVTGATFASAAVTENTVGLHKATAGGGACPSDALEGQKYWHFVAVPNDGTAITGMTLMIDGEAVSFAPDSWIADPKDSHAYVPVPEGSDFGSLSVDGSTFTVIGTTKDVRLSHTCTGGDGTPPPPPVKVESLVVSKTAVTEFHRDHDWTITKSVDKTAVKLYTDGSGDTAVNYTVDVAHTKSTDSGWNVSGKITITNNGETTATIVAVEDSLMLNPLGADPGLVAVSCGVEGDIILDVGDDIECTYTHDVDGAVDGTNNVTVTTLEKEYKASASVTWGDPTTETDKNVSVTDEGTLVVAEGADSGDFTAPTGGTLTYKTEELTYAAYGQAKCGSPHTYPNTATLKGDGDRTLGTASASVSVDVQCYVFDKNHTAWGFGDRYIAATKKNDGDWAMVSTFQDGATIDLIAGQFYDAGDIAFALREDGRVDITVTLAGDWRFLSGSETLKIQGYDVNPAGKVKNVPPGQFAYKSGNYGTDTTEVTVTVPKSNFYGIHASVGEWIPDPSF